MILQLFLYTPNFPYYLRPQDDIAYDTTIAFVSILVFLS
ncbi:hypothetical protein FRA_71c15880 [Francisella sp. W12-1067]|nr:hypothetical protein FRA_71c15880 [Francisella sp. W12-1067]